MSQCEVLSNSCLHGDYFCITFAAPEIASAAVAGQFVHVRIDERQDKMLRRPFSIHDTDPVKGTLTLVYKKVGFGTAELSRKKAGDICDILGPIGKGFTPCSDDVIPVAVAGGYGSAAMYLLHRTCAKPGVLLIGARNSNELILENAYGDLGWEVKISTDDGSAGYRGRVTELIPQLLAENPGRKFFFYGCGPLPMLKSLAAVLRENNLDGELSVDQVMCCGVGACFGCVVKVADENSPDKWSYARSCVDGPVFPLEKFYMEQ